MAPYYLGGQTYHNLTCCCLFGVTPPSLDQTRPSPDAIHAWLVRWRRPGQDLLHRKTSTPLPKTKHQDGCSSKASPTPTREEVGSASSGSQRPFPESHDCLSRHPSSLQAHGSSQAGTFDLPCSPWSLTQSQAQNKCSINTR